MFRVELDLEQMRGLFSKVSKFTIGKRYTLIHLLLGMGIRLARPAGSELGCGNNCRQSLIKVRVQTNIQLVWLHKAETLRGSLLGIHMSSLQL